MFHTIDMHCDTLMHAFLEDGGNADVYHRPELCIDAERLAKAGAMAQFFAIFIVPDRAYEYHHHPVLTHEEYINGCAQVFRNTIERHSAVMAKAENGEEIETNFHNGTVSAVLTMEDGVAVDGKMENLDHFYEMGVRALALTWNFENCFGYPNSKDPEINGKGLKPFGIEAVKHMQDIGMLVDVSHLNDAGFDDVCRIAKVPFIASHSNARSVCNHSRNLTDDRIKALAKAGGVMGLNFMPGFLDDTEGNRLSRIDDMVQMIQHEKEIAGIEVCAIGTDFDGFDGEKEIASCDQIHLLYDALAKAGFSAEEIEKIACGNVMRVIHEAMH